MSDPFNPVARKALEGMPVLRLAGLVARALTMLWRPGENQRHVICGGLRISTVCWAWREGHHTARHSAHFLRPHGLRERYGCPSNEKQGARPD